MRDLYYRKGTTLYTEQKSKMKKFKTIKQAIDRYLKVKEDMENALDYHGTLFFRKKEALYGDMILEMHAIREHAEKKAKNTFNIMLDVVGLGDKKGKWLPASDLDYNGYEADKTRFYIDDIMVNGRRAPYKHKQAQDFNNIFRGIDLEWMDMSNAQARKAIFTYAQKRKKEFRTSLKNQEFSPSKKRCVALMEEANI